MKLPKSGDGTGDSSMLPVPSPFQRVKSVHLFFPLSHPRPPFLVKNRQTHTYINFTTTALSSFTVSTCTVIPTHQPVPTLTPTVNP